MEQDEVKVEKVDESKLTRQFLFDLTEYIIKQSENGKTRCHLVEWNLSGDGFIVNRVQYKNGKQDFSFNCYADGVVESLRFTKNLEYIYNLFRDRVF